MRVSSHGGDASQDEIREPLFSDLLPKVFGWVELGAVGRQVEKLHVGGDDERSRFVPTGLIHEHEDGFFRMSFRDDGEEQRHRIRVDAGKNKRIENSVERAHCRIGVGVFPDQLEGHRRPCALGRPTASRVADPAETRLVLEHDAYGCIFCRSLLCYVGEFFLNSSWRSESAFG